MPLLKPCIRILLFAIGFQVTLSTQHAFGQTSIARLWNEELLQAIRLDFARPPVHARNLFHSSLAMYDIWAAYDTNAQPFLLGNTVHGFPCPFTGVPTPADVQASRKEAISYAMYRILSQRFKDSPGKVTSLASFANLMNQLGYDTAQHSKDYASGSAAALGNYVAQCVINFGIEDGANELGNYAYRFYEPLNPPIDPVKPGNPDILDPNRWQPIAFDQFIDQAGNLIPGSLPKFLGPEWGNVIPFALSGEDRKTGVRNGHTYTYYHDLGAPPYYGQSTMDDYRWGMNLVAVWSSHLDPTDGVMWDISPASMGNAPALPTTYAAYHNFYKLIDGGDAGTGRNINPVTGSPYVPQLVPRGDYVRVLAEFWADGPNSETPPGHWFSILNYVSDHPQMVKKFKGVGDELDDLEWDVKAYFTLGGAVHDAAVASWGLKGWYDYVRPLSGIRFLADLGQHSDPLLPHYNVGGITLIPGKIEVVLTGDPLAGPDNLNVGKIKVKAWRSHDVISDPATETAGVGWILAEHWWPYQRRTFITPPFAGFVSGHSTFSRASAEVLTLLTGTPYFPGGMGEFVAHQNQFLVFEEGPSVDVRLQWATYQDASDQTSLSRIWGGIHVPADDIIGRIIGREVGVQAFERAEQYFAGTVTALPKENTDGIVLYPNPSLRKFHIRMPTGQPFTIRLMDQRGSTLKTIEEAGSDTEVSLDGIDPGLYLVEIRNGSMRTTRKLIVRGN